MWLLRYLEWLYSESSTEDTDGREVMVPPWNLILIYELWVRDHAADCVNINGMDAAAALKAGRAERCCVLSRCERK